MSTIQAIILDIDGVIIGEKSGYNFPSPHSDVLKALKNVREKNIPVILCTAKPNFSITDIIQGAHLNNLHITDGGSVIIDPIGNDVFEELLLDKKLVKEIVQLLIDKNVYTELYTYSDYYIQKDQVSETTEVHQAILQKGAKVVDSLFEASQRLEVTKIMFVVKNLEDKETVAQFVAPFEQQASINWGLHPTALPRQFGFIVNKNTSKKDAAIKIINHLGVPFDSVLGVGDTTGDWKFMEPCGYAATLENGSEEIKALVKTKGDKSFIGRSVDENGLLDILSHFGLL